MTLFQRGHETPSGDVTRENAQRLGIWASVCALAAVIGFAIGSDPPSLEAALVLATGVAVGAPAAIRLARGKRIDVLEPLVLYVLAYGTMFVLRPFYMLATGDMYYTLAGTSVDLSVTFAPMQVLALLGAVAFGLAYEVSNARGTRSGQGAVDFHVPTLDTTLLRWGAAMLLGAGVIGTVVRVQASGGLATVLAGRSTEYFAAQVAASKFLLYAPIPLIPSGLLFFALAFKERKARDLAGLVVAFAFMVVAFGFTGGRIQFLPFLLGPIAYLFLITGKRPGLGGVLLGLLVALAVSAVVGQARNVDSRADTGFGGAAVNVFRHPAAIFEPLTTGQDAAEAPALASALTAIPRPVAHTYGRATVGDFALRFVPRAFWPGKPVAARETVVQAIWGDAYYSGAANPEFSALLSWYLDGGALGVVIGLALYGWVFARLFGMVRDGPVSAGSALVFASALPLGVRALRDSPTDVSAQALFIIAPVVLVVLVARSRDRRTLRNAS